MNIKKSAFAFNILLAFDLTSFATPRQPELWFNVGETYQDEKSAPFDTLMTAIKTYPKTSRIKVYWDSNAGIGALSTQAIYDKKHGVLWLEHTRIGFDEIDTKAAIYSIIQRYRYSKVTSNSLTRLARKYGHTFNGQSSLEMSVFPYLIEFGCKRQTLKQATKTSYQHH